MDTWEKLGTYIQAQIDDKEAEIKKIEGELSALYSIKAFMHNLSKLNGKP